MPLKKFNAYIDEILSERLSPKPARKRGAYKTGKRLPNRATDSDKMGTTNGKAMTNQSRQHSERRRQASLEKNGGIVTDRKGKRGSKAETRTQTHSIKKSFLK